MHALRLAAAFEISRQEQDDYAGRSHQLAHDAFQNGHLDDILSVTVPGGHHMIICKMCTTPQVTYLFLLYTSRNVSHHYHNIINEFW